MTSLGIEVGLSLFKYSSIFRLKSVSSSLTLYGPNSYFRRFSGHNLR